MPIPATQNLSLDDAVNEWMEMDVEYQGGALRFTIQIPAETSFMAFDVKAKDLKKLKKFFEDLEEG